MTRIVYGLLAVFLVFGMVGCGEEEEEPEGGREEQGLEVKTVIDGDTIDLDDGTRVRYIGINAPEKGMSYYSQAKEANRQLVEGRGVTLEFDMEEEDGYGRTLAYVYVDSIFVNERLVRDGLALAWPYPPNLRYKRIFSEAEQKARDEQIGMWTRDVLWGKIEIKHIEFDAPGNDHENLNGEWVEILNSTDLPMDMTGFTLSDIANHSYTFPDFVLPAHASVEVFTGSGPDTESSLYWGSRSAIWNNDGDTAYLRDADGPLIDEYAY